LGIEIETKSAVLAGKACVIAVAGLIMKQNILRDNCFVDSQRRRLPPVARRNGKGKEKEKWLCFDFAFISVKEKLTLQ